MSRYARHLISDEFCEYNFIGRVVTFEAGGQEKIEITSKHNHEGDQTRVELKRLQGDVQEEAMKSKEVLRGILAGCLLTVPEDAEGFVDRSNVARNIRNIRHQAKLEPANSKSLDKLVVGVLFC